MNAFLWYTLKASASLIVFYSFYILLLRNCTFFFLNRFYLVTGLILSCIIPVLKFSIFNGQSNHVFPNGLNNILIVPELDFFNPKNLSNGINPINYSSVLLVIYFSGIAILFFKLLFSIMRVNRVINNSKISLYGKMKIVRMDSPVPFSFFNTIFLPANETNAMIIEHEITHIKQFHWVDLIIAEAVSLLLWFNPIVILYKSSLKLQHEYLADNNVVKGNNQIGNYLGCMLRHVQIVGSGGLISHFYCKTIKKRIVMITKNKTSVKYLGIYLLILPIVFLMLFAFTSGNSKSGFISGQKITLNVNDDVPSICPVDVKKVTATSGYGKRINPMTKKDDFHHAIDFALAEGEKVMSTANGVVVEAQSDLKNGMGNYILIKHNEVYSTFYAHLKSISVKAGDQLIKGQVIGYVGNTGISVGPHLHYEVIKNGERVDPKGYMPKMN